MRKALTILDSTEFLRQRSNEVNFSDPELRENIADLKEYCENNYCYALASIQIGIPKRIVFIKSTDELANENDKEKQFILINPQIISMKGKTQFYEACISCLDNTALIDRPYELTIKYNDEDGNERIETFTGFSSTVISHELDHLDGIFHMDRAKGDILQLPKEERMKFRKVHPYKVISTNCQFKYEPISFQQ